MKVQVTEEFAKRLPWYGFIAFALSMYLMDFVMWSANLTQEDKKDN